MERLTEKRDGQNVIPLRQDGKLKWSLNSAGMGDAVTQFLYGAHVDKLAEYEEVGTVEEFKKALQNVKTLSEMYEKLSDKEVAEYHELKRYKELDEQGKLMENPQELKDSILNRMKEFMDEYRSYSESTVDYFGGKADTMETAMRIVRSIFSEKNI